MSLTLQCVIIRIVTVFVENNNDDDDAKKYFSNECNDIYEEMLQIISKNNAYYEKFKQNNNYNYNYTKSINMNYSPSIPIPIPYNK